MRYSCRIISENHTLETENLVKNYFTETLRSLGIVQIEFSDLKPYWKIPGYGEMQLIFSAGNISIGELQELLASNWKDEVADSEWSNIYCHKIVFIWLCEF